MKKARRPAFRILRLLAMALLCLAGVMWLHYDSSAQRDKEKPGNVDELLLQCKGRSIHIYDLPPQFNTDLMKNCSTQGHCAEYENDGLGPSYDSDEKSLLTDTSSWFSTGTHSLELLIHQRLRRHPCLTKSPEKAQLFYVPFYAAMEFQQHMMLPADERDKLTLELFQWLRKQPTFARQGGLDHFMTIGGPSYNFARGKAKTDWGTGMMHHTEFKKILKLEIEPVGTLGHSTGIPYPTDFHPITYKKLRQYQAMVNSRKRPYLWGIVWIQNGSYSQEPDTVRTVAVKQCKASANCLLLDCRNGCTHAERMSLWLNVQYAAGEGGDVGKRYMFDAMLAGAVPIIMWEPVFSLYKKYLPISPTLSLIHGDEYSIFLPSYDVPEWTPIEHRISRVKPKRYLQLKRKIVSLIPSLTYFHHDNLIHGVEDAFLVAMKSVFEHLAKVSEDFEVTDEEAEQRRTATAKLAKEAEKEEEKAKVAEETEPDVPASKAPEADESQGAADSEAKDGESTDASKGASASNDDAAGEGR